MKNDYSDDEKKLAAYALNMCTVSVSQIIDYNDVYILEQEYEAILNNLNLEKFPKTDALYNVLVEILNTVTFFRIQEIKKEQIERKYRKKVKNAIWSSMNALTILATGAPWAMAFTAAMQIGIGYINYRRVKSDINLEKENEELELRITAMEQFHALQRELFSTAWKMAEEFGFVDQYRITERQLKQYNEILMDLNPKRRYDRLAEIKDNFQAYPQFLYFLGHAAYEAARETSEIKLKSFYLAEARDNFQKFIDLQKMGLLREDQIVSSCALEYVDLLNPDENSELIINLLDLAVANSGTMNDIRQICALGYLKVNNHEGNQKAVEQLFHLVNSDYNRTVNAQLLSYILVKQISEEQSFSDSEIKYLKLKECVRPEYLYALPDNNLPKECLDSDFCSRQKDILKKKFTLVIKELIRKYQVDFNKILPIPYADKSYPDEYFADTSVARIDRENEVDIISKIPGRWEEFCNQIDIIDIKYDYLMLFNRLLVSIGGLEIISKDAYGNLVTELEKSIKASTEKFDTLYDNQQQSDGLLKFEDYKELHSLCFNEFTKEFFEKLKVEIRAQIEIIDSIALITSVESDLDDLCASEGIVSPDYLYEHKDDVCEIKESSLILSAELFGSDVKLVETKNARAEAMSEVIEKYVDKILKDDSKAEIYYGRTPNAYGKYFSQPYLFDFNKKLKKEALLIVNDKSVLKNYDLMLTVSGIVPIYKGKAQSTLEYAKVKWINGSDLFIGEHPYKNKGIDLESLKQLFDELAKIH